MALFNPKRLLFFVILFIFTLITFHKNSFVLGQTPKASTNNKPVGVTIYRDDYGVPHVFGKTDADAIFGFAYAQAEDNFLLIENGFIKAIGRSSEIDGESGLFYDKIVKALEIQRLSIEEYKKSNKEMHAIYDAYAGGLNYYLKTHPKVKPVLLKQIEPWYTIALLRYKYYVLEFIWNTGIQKKDFKIAVEEKREEENQGSNAWAVMPSKSTSGNALLFQNPHISFYGPAQYYEGHLYSEEGLNFSGAARYGFPFPYLGHNEYLGWSYTDNDIDNGDLYKETFNHPSNPLAYKYGNSYKTAIEWKDKIKIKTANGVKTHEYIFRKTDHGPIVSEYENKPVAVKLAKLEEGGWYSQWLKMLKAKSFSEFKTILKNVYVPYMNITYADREGNIFYCYYGAIPKRSTAFNWRQPVDGADPETEWKGYLSFEELPQVLNPKSGFIQNCNSSPFVTTSSGNPEQGNYPPYITGPKDQNNPRSIISREILTETEKFTFENWQKAATDTRVYNARKFKKQIVSEFESLRNADLQRYNQLIGLIDELNNWDCISRKESTAMTLFILTTLSTISPQSFKSYSYQLSIPLINRLEVIKDYLETTWGTWKVPWGEINRHQRIGWDEKDFDDKKTSLPIAGGPGNIGIIFNFYWSADDLIIEKTQNQKQRYGRMGNSYVAVVEFGPVIKAKSILYYGQCGDSSSPHYFDQAGLYSEGKFKPAWFYLEDIKKHSTPPYHPGRGK